MALERLIIIDGYNLIHRSEALRPGAGRTLREARATAQTRAKPATRAPIAPERDVVPWLRALGFRADEARRAAERCDEIPDAPLEQRVRAALSFLSPARPVSPSASARP